MSTKPLIDVRDLWCDTCLKAGYRCKAYDIRGGKPLCIFCYDGVTCTHGQKNRAAVATPTVAPPRTQPRKEKLMPTIAELTQKWIGTVVAQGATLSLNEVISQVRRGMITGVLIHHRGNQSKAAKTLGVHRNTLLRDRHRLREANLPDPVKLAKRTAPTRRLPPARPKPTRRVIENRFPFEARTALRRNVCASATVARKCRRVRDSPTCAGT